MDLCKSINFEFRAFQQKKKRKKSKAKGTEAAFCFDSSRIFFKRQTVTLLPDHPNQVVWLNLAFATGRRHNRAGGGGWRMAGGGRRWKVSHKQEDEPQQIRRVLIRFGRPFCVLVFRVGTGVFTTKWRVTRTQSASCESISIAENIDLNLFHHEKREKKRETK